MKTQKGWCIIAQDGNLFQEDGSLDITQEKVSMFRQPVLVLIGADSIVELAELQDKAQKYENLQAEIEKRAAKIFDAGKDGD